MNRQLRAARRVRCEQLRYVVIISIRSCQCHRTRSSFQVAAKSRTSRFETTIEDENRDEKMIRTKSNRIPLYERTLRIEDDTRTTDTRAPTRKYVPRGKRCVTITIPSLDPRDSNDRSIFSRPLVFGRGRDNATRFDRLRFYVVLYRTVTPTVRISRGKIHRGISRRDIFQHRHRRLHVRCQSRGIVMQSSFEDVPRGLCTVEHVVRRSTPRRSREEEERVARDPRLRNLLHRAIFAPVNFSLQLPSVFSCQVIALSRTKQIFFLLPFFIFLSSRFSFLSSIHDRTTRTKGHTSFSRD